MRYSNPQHRGLRLQRGRGLGSIFGSLFKWLSPIVAKGVSAGKSALKNPHVRAGLKDVQKSAIKAGVRKIDKVLNPMEEEEEEERVVCLFVLYFLLRLYRLYKIPHLC